MHTRNLIWPGVWGCVWPSALGTFCLTVFHGNPRHRKKQLPSTNHPEFVCGRTLGRNGASPIGGGGSGGRRRLDLLIAGKLFGNKMGTLWFYNIPWTVFGLPIGHPVAGDWPRKFELSLALFFAHRRVLFYWSHRSTTLEPFSPPTGFNNRCRDTWRQRLYYQFHRIIRRALKMACLS